MKYFLFHSQILKDGQVTSVTQPYDDRDAVEIAFHQAVAYDMSAVDAVAESRIAVLNETMAVEMSKVYIRPAKAPDPVEENILEEPTFVEDVNEEI